MGRLIILKEDEINIFYNGKEKETNKKEKIVIE